MADLGWGDKGMTDAIRDALSFGIWSCSGPTTADEIARVEDQIEETWQEYRTTPQYARAAQPEYLFGCQLRGPGECQKEGKCLSASCVNYGKEII
jgi:hypothetical protein